MYSIRRPGWSNLFTFFGDLRADFKHRNVLMSGPGRLLSFVCARAFKASSRSKGRIIVPAAAAIVATHQMTPFSFSSPPLIWREHVRVHLTPGRKGPTHSSIYLSFRVTRPTTFKSNHASVLYKDAPTYQNAARSQTSWRLARPHHTNVTTGGARTSLLEARRAHRQALNHRPGAGPRETGVRAQSTAQIFAAANRVHIRMHVCMTAREGSTIPFPRRR